MEYINESFRKKSLLGEKYRFDCPIQQYLADGDPDVDAIYWLTTEEAEIIPQEELHLVDLWIRELNHLEASH